MWVYSDAVDKPVCLLGMVSDDVFEKMDHHLAGCQSINCSVEHWKEKVARNFHVLQKERKEKRKSLVKLEKEKIITLMVFH